MRMRSTLSIALAFAAAILLAACSPAAAPKDNKKTGNEAGKSTGGHEEHEGEPHDLGKVKIGDVEISVTQMGHVEAGKEITFELAYKTEGVTAVRGWIGMEDGSGTEHAKAHAHGDDIDVHITVAKAPAEGAMLWLEVETASGKTKGSLKLASH
ncbi:MAG: hypothetical protein AB7K09_04895 [Planctomycetota bacterium]